MRIVIILCIITQITCWSFPVHERVSWINFLIATIIYIMHNLIDNKHRWSINPNLLQKSCIQSGSIEKKNVNTPQSTLSKLGIWVLPNRRMCFAGRTIKGIVLPKNAKQQEKAMKSLIVWYLPCLEYKNSDPTKLHSFQMNNACFFRRQNELLKVYSKFSAWNIYRLPLN